MNYLTKKIQLKNKVFTHITLFIALLLSAICYNLFLLKLNIVAGGGNGIATIIKHLFGIDQSLTLLIISVFFLIISYIFLGKEKTVTITIASFLYPLLVKMTSPIIDIVQFDTNDMFVIVIFAGLLNGFATGLMYKTGYNSGGICVLNQILHEKCKIPMATSVLLTNVIIILAGTYYFGIEKSMYAIILLYISNIIMDRVLIGISKNKAFYIITSETDKVSNYVKETLGHNTTYFEVKGGFLEKRKNAILTVIPTYEYYRVKEGIKMIDKKAFFVVTDSFEVKGAK